MASLTGKKNFFFLNFALNYITLLTLKKTSNKKWEQLHLTKLQKHFKVGSKLTYRDLGNTTVFILHDSFPAYLENHDTKILEFFCKLRNKNKTLAATVKICFNMRMLFFMKTFLLLPHVHVWIVLIQDSFLKYTLNSVFQKQPPQVFHEKRCS